MVLALLASQAVLPELTTHLALLRTPTGLIAPVLPMLPTRLSTLTVTEATTCPVAPLVSEALPASRAQTLALETAEVLSSTAATPEPQAALRRVHSVPTAAVSPMPLILVSTPTVITAVTWVPTQVPELTALAPMVLELSAPTLKVPASKVLALTALAPMAALVHPRALMVLTAAVLPMLPTLASTLTAITAATWVPTQVPELRVLALMVLALMALALTALVLMALVPLAS